MPKIETTGLVFDPSIYPRKGIDAYNVLKLRRAIEGGSKLPPVLTLPEHLQNHRRRAPLDPRQRTRGSHIRNCRWKFATAAAVII